MMERSSGQSRVAINAIRARLTILGFNLAITTFQINNTHGLGGGSHFEGFETTVHLGAGTVLLTGIALSIASMVTFITSSALDREGTCDHRPLLAGDLLMYLALAQTVAGFFGPYLSLLEGVSMQTEADQEAVSAIRVGKAPKQGRQNQSQPCAAETTAATVTRLIVSSTRCMRSIKRNVPVGSRSADCRNHLCRNKGSCTKSITVKSSQTTVMACRYQREGSKYQPQACIAWTM